MPSSYTVSHRFERQFTGENVNTWGDRLNVTIDRVDTAIGGMVTKALTGVAYSLTSSNTTDDESRAAMLKFTGIGATVTIPNVSKKYTVWNACSSAVTITTGSGTTVVVDAGDIVDVFCTGVDVKTLGYNSVSLKAYIASVVVGGGASLPSAVGNANKFLTNNGSTPLWQTLGIGDLGDYDTDQADKIASATGRAIAFAIAL